MNHSSMVKKLKQIKKTKQLDSPDSHERNQMEFHLQPSEFILIAKFRRLLIENNFVVMCCVFDLILLKTKR